MTVENLESPLFLALVRGLIRVHLLDQRLFVEGAECRSGILEHDRHPEIPACIFAHVIAGRCHFHRLHAPHLNLLLQQRIVVLLEEIEEFLLVAPLHFVVVLDHEGLRLRGLCHRHRAQQQEPNCQASEFHTRHLKQPKTSVVTPFFLSSRGRRKPDEGSAFRGDSILLLVIYPTHDELRHAAELLRAGRLVAFPTETVYGLGANALSAEAVARIFEAKGRPHTSPLIVHVASPESAREVVSHWPEAASKLAARFWPGPLTLVLPKQPVVPDIVTAGLRTVGVRVPAHPVALALLRECGLPLAAPSANRFTQLSPTTAEHVRRSLGDRVDYILDGGPCTVGIESTVISLAEEPTILRPGGISRAQIEEVVGRVSIAAEATAGAHASPGMHAKHYSPRTKLILSDSDVPDYGVGVYLRISRNLQQNLETMQMPTTPSAYASALYATLHDLDQRKLDWIAVELPPDTPEWAAVTDRLRRAAH